MRFQTIVFYAPNQTSSRKFSLIHCTVPRSTLKLSSNDGSELINYRVHNVAGSSWSATRIWDTKLEFTSADRAVRNEPNLPCDPTQTTTLYYVPVITLRSTSFHSNSGDRPCVLHDSRAEILARDGTHGEFVSNGTERGWVWTYIKTFFLRCVEFKCFHE